MFKQNIPDLDTNDLSQFCLILAGLLVFLFGLFLPWRFNWNMMPNYYFIGVGFCIFIWTFVNVNSMAGLYKGWMRVSLTIGVFVNLTILSIIFFLLIMPIGIIRKFFVKDPLFLNFDPDIKSYRIKSNITNKESIERPY